MSTLKDVLCLLAILIAYGIVGRMDYDDAVMLEEGERAAADCVAEPVTSTPASGAWERQIASGPPHDPAPCPHEPFPELVE